MITVSHKFADDNVLLAELNVRNSAAFTCLFKMWYKDLVYFSMKHFTITTHSFEDSVQDVFLVLWESDLKFETLKNVKGYLYSSLKNNYLNQLKHQLVEERYCRFLSKLDKEEDMLDDIFETELISSLHKYICRLPKGTQRVISMSLDGLKNKEIADKLNLSVHTINVQKVKGLSLLRRWLNKPC